MRKYLILTLMLLGGVLCSNAATKEEMEKARALVAKWGVRSQNSASGYLDGINPTNIEQVKASVSSHDTDNSNLSKMSFSMPPASEYESWDKTAMINYWMGQYNSKVPSSAPDKSYCSTRLKSQLGGLSATVVAKPAPVPEPAQTPEAANPAATPGTDQQAQTEATAQNPAADNAQKPEEQKVDNNTNINFNEIEQAEGNPETEPLASMGEFGKHDPADGAKEFEESGSNTWIIIVLVVLVLVVLALVGYASNMMARNNKRDKGNPRRHRDEDRNDYRRRDGYDDRYEDDDEIILPGQDEGTDYGRREADYGAGDYQHRGGHHDYREPGRGDSMTYGAPRAQGNRPRIIYLSNANSDGVFLRAEAQYNLGNSIFKLVTTDGYSGTFSVIDDPNVHEMALMMPVDFLVNACTGRNLQLSQGARAIVTDSTGTAVFENGRWRVARKAQIHYTR